MSTIVTRIAPSPTGYMHIGTARTALFNWLYARGRGGKFLLRIEDTDKERSTKEATEAIFAGLDWLGLDYDDAPVFQAERAERHVEVAHHLLEIGKAYRCFATPEEISAFREEARAAGRSTNFQSPWRDIPESDHPNAPYVVRIKAPRQGETTIEDQVQGHVKIKNETLDDMILLRSDGSPVYMLAVVVDDHDMGVTHVIRGDDHLNNAARQMLIYDAMDWPLPIYAHIPLIYGPDGKKLSKRHGATSVEEYKAMGYPAVAMRNYLARLGWSHGDDEFFDDNQAQEWFDLSGINKAPSRFDFKKLQNVSGQHMKAMDDAALLHELVGFTEIFATQVQNEEKRDSLIPAISSVKNGAKSLQEALDKMRFILVSHPFDMDAKAQASLNEQGLAMIRSLTPQLHNAKWTREDLETLFATITEEFSVGFGKLAAPLRAALSGRSVSPSVYDMMLILGREETILRLQAVIDTK